MHWSGYAHIASRENQLLDILIKKSALRREVINEVIIPTQAGTRIKPSNLVARTSQSECKYSKSGIFYLKYSDYQRGR